MAGTKLIIKLCPDSEMKKIWGNLVKERDSYLCRRCNNQLSHTGCVAQAHHIIPVAAGGMHTIDNGVTLCRSCHNYVHINIRKGISYMDALSV